MTNCCANFRAQPSLSKQPHKVQIKKVEFFYCNKYRLAVKPTIQQNSAVSKELLGKC